ncbi:ABC transporter permease [Acidocella facilis]|uniref:ABC transporter permease n=1 Tax=Acidocella facilis TaxID=525 RepID=UPI001F3A673D|nr:ABC transporter permease [Acidocella facilis]
MLFRLEPRGERSAFWSIGSPVLAILLTIVTMMVIFALLGKPPVRGIETFLITPIASVSGLSSLAVRAAPLIMIGAGLALCYRANVWNIGGDGQFTMGALAGAGVALALPNGAFWWEYPLVLALGVLGGMVWAGLVAWLKLKFNANEILTSLMLVYVANLILVWLVTGPWRDPQGFGFPQSAMFGAGATTPDFGSTSIHLGCALAPVLALVLWQILGRSVLGFQLRVVGQAPRAARFAGFSNARLTWIALLVSGGLSGLAGIIEVTGPIGQLTTTITPGYGFSAVIVAFLGRLHPVGVIFAGLLLALSYLGGDAAQINLNMPNAITGIFQGVLLFYLLGADVLILHRVRRIRPRATEAA